MMPSEARQRNEPTAQPPLPILEDWLRIATRGLCEAAVKRIQSEVSSHYREAVEAYRSQGIPEEEAQRRAGECLGDPNAARKGFQRTYLVKWQEGLLSWQIGLTDADVGWAFVLFVVVGVVLALGQLLTSEAMEALTLANAALFVLVTLVCLFLIVCLPYLFKVWAPRCRGEMRPTSMAAWHFGRRPRIMTVLMLALCIPYIVHAATDGPSSHFLLMGAFTWFCALRGAWKLLWGGVFRRSRFRDALGVCLGSALALLAMVVLQQAVDSITRFDVQGDGVIAVEYPAKVLAWGLGVAFLTTTSLLTFLGAWLARKRGNGPSQATPEPVRDDAI